MNGLLSPLLRKIRFRNSLPFISKKGNILDIGCAKGEIIKCLPKEINYLGIEGSKEYFKEACRKYGADRFINLSLRADNSLSLKIPKQDTILMLAVLEHLGGPVKIVRNLSKYLNKKGKIIITTPDKKAKKILELGLRIGIFSQQNKDHKHYFSRRELNDLAKKVGLKVKYYQAFEFGLNHLIVLERHK